MPYIDRKDRKKFQKSINELVKLAKNNGELKYIISEFIGGWIAENNLYSYSGISNTISALHEAELELYRRILAPYEMGKIDKSEDLDSFNKILNTLVFITGREPVCSPIVKEVT